jgi:Flp pilus assembly pilin Flp
MIGIYLRIQDAIRQFSAEQSGQDAFEYLLVIGGISAFLVLTMVTPIGSTLIGHVIKGTCDAVALAMPSVSCSGVGS